MGPVLDKHIERTPDTCGGRACLSGTRIRVQDVAALSEFQGMSPDEIVAGYPQISLADVHAALAYYHDHRTEINRQMTEDDHFVDAIRSGTLKPGRGKDADSISS